MKAKNMRVLVVEDYLLVAWALRLLVSDSGHFVVGIATNPRTALELARHHRPDLALMDIRLEGDTSGVDAARDLWQQCGVPSVYTTAYGRDAAGQDGIVGTLIKPYNRHDVCRMLECTERLIAGNDPGPLPDQFTLYCRELPRRDRQSVASDRPTDARDGAEPAPGEREEPEAT